MRLAVLLLSVASLAGCAGSEPAPVVPLTGSYESAHTISALGADDWEDVDVTDRLAVIERGDSLDVSFTLLHTNYHICEWHGTMTREAEVWTARETLEYADESPECVLQLEVSADSLTLRDEDWVCRRAYCGVRGVIDGVGFRRDTRTADTSWRDELR